MPRAGQLTSSCTWLGGAFALALIACGSFIDPFSGEDSTPAPAPSAKTTVTTPDAAVAAADGAVAVDSGPTSTTSDGGIDVVDAGQCSTEGVCAGLELDEPKTCCPGFVCFSANPGDKACVACTPSGGNCATDHSPGCCEGTSCNGTVCK